METEQYEDMDYRPDFRLLGIIDLAKSLQDYDNRKDAGIEDPQRIVWGEISNINPDEENEVLLQKAIDYSYFDDGKGWIKYEHTPKNHPKNIIGVPHERMTTDNNTVLKAALLDGTEYADYAWDLIQAINRHNKRYPDKQRTLGWSVEGDYIDGKRAKGGIRKAKVINVVITPNPVNKTTYLKTMEENHTAFFKSLSATPVKTNLSEKMGGDSITKENIDKKLVDTSESSNEGNLSEKDSDGKKKKKKKKKEQLNKSKNRRNAMFNSYEEAIEFYEDNGIEEEKASIMAKAQFPGHDEDGYKYADQETKGLLKGISEKIGNLTEVFKSVDPDEDDEDDYYDDPLDDDPLDIEGDEVDVTEVLGSMDKSIRNTSESLDELVGYTHERDIAMADALSEVGDISDQLDELKKSMTVEIDGKSVPLNHLVAVISKSVSNVPIDLNQFEIIGDPEGNGNAHESKLPPWSEMQKSLAKGLEGKKITPDEALRAEASHRSGAGNMVKSIMDKCQ